MIFDKKYFRIDENDTFEALERLLKICKGGYACVAMITGYGILGFRDPHGIRPLVYGRRGNDYMMASESVALDSLGFTIVDDVKPGLFSFSFPSSQN